MNVKKTNLNALFIFIQPPSIEELERRLVVRASEPQDAIKSRLETAKKELEYAKLEGSHDKVIINDDVDKAYAELEEFIMKN